MSGCLRPAGSLVGSLDRISDVFAIAQSGLGNVTAVRVLYGKTVPAVGSRLFTPNVEFRRTVDQRSNARVNPGVGRRVGMKRDLALFVGRQKALPARDQVFVHSL